DSVWQDSRQAAPNEQKCAKITQHIFCRRSRSMGGFQKAQRRRVYIKLALTRPSGSGKTFSALRLAFGLGTRVAMLDSENGSGSLYAHLGDYDVMEIDSPFSVPK